MVNKKINKNVNSPWAHLKLLLPIKVGILFALANVDSPNVLWSVYFLFI